jgi:diguanylate cyclase (GGDEF)-like protein/PAS domain S-box-containing protein
MSDDIDRNHASQSLSESLDIFQLLLDYAPVSLAMFDLEMRYLAVSRRWQADYSIDNRNIIGLSHYEIFPEIDERWKQVHRRCMVGEIISSEEDCFVRDNGTIQWLRWQVLPWHSKDGNIGGIIIFSEDITRHKQVEEAMLQHNLRMKERAEELIVEIGARKQTEKTLKEFAAIIESSDDAILSLNLDGFIISWNSGAERMYGYSRIEAIGRHISFVIPKDLQHREAKLLDCIRNGDNVTHYETLHIGKDAKLINVSVSLSPTLDQDGNIIGASKIARDITERKLAEELVHNLAFYDTLTKLPNRRMLYDRLERELAANKRRGHYCALLFLDLDNFKPLNDLYGHEVGDLMLIEVARRISSCVREMDTAARFGGDEFVVMLIALDKNKAQATLQANNIAEKIRSKLAQPYRLTIQKNGIEEFSIEHHSSSSIGVELFINNNETTPEEIIKLSDIAMYQAKEAGGNGVRFYELSLKQQTHAYNKFK